MSGIVGLIHPGRHVADREAAVVRMVRAVRHRGPDTQGVVSSGGGTFGAAVLVTDPLHSAREPVDRVFAGGRRFVGAIDGILHNRVELIEDLAAEGFELESPSHAEVALAAVACWGDLAIGKLEGAFALVVWDERASTLLLVRDKFGAKSLYTLREGDLFAFGSEQKALLTLGRRTPSLEGVCEMFMHGAAFAAGHTLGDRTFFDGIEALPPGHALRVSPSGTRRWRYWSLAEESVEAIRDRDVLLELQEDAFSQTVRRMVAGHNGVGSLLSGGVDSSLAASEACARLPYPVISTCISFRPDHDDPDPMAAALVSRWLNARAPGSHRLVFTDVPMVSLLDDLDDLVRAGDEPQWDTRNIGLFRCYRTLRDQGVTSALSGDLASQIAFGNYPRFLGWRASPPGTPPMQTPGAFAAAWRARLGPVRELLAPAFGSGAIDPSRPDALIDEAIATSLSPWWNAPEDRDLAVGIWYILTFGYSLVAANNRLGMWHSVEPRFPYAGERMLRLALRTPFEWSTADTDITCGKAVLRQLGRTRLPREIWHDRAGKPLPAPIAVRYHLSVADRLEQEIPLAPPAVWDLFDRQVVERMLAEFRAHVVPIAAATPDAGESVTLFNPTLPVRTVHLFSVLNVIRWFAIYQD